eukprot:TRINITY_DN1120_c3_g1_i1.p1 TRINITY_DN1120_c3_g1~~TRINITY_DN1120_c3_g1_i1.p1  ORF type:complete len:277 (+),score=41.90 TRINITY_DN1120_c3_g1_i1:72-833(+)
MVCSTYHDKRKMDHKNIYQLSFYNEVDRICNFVRHQCAADDGGEDDDGDGSSNSSGDGYNYGGHRHSEDKERIRSMLNTRGGVSSVTTENSNIENAYLLLKSNGSRFSPPSWQLRSITGLTSSKYEKYGASPLHFACASRSRESMILLLQNGCEDFRATFYGSTSLSGYDMIQNDDDLKSDYSFWISQNTLWSRDSHKHFTSNFRRLVDLFMKVNDKSRNWLCNDLSMEVISWIPTDVVLLNEWSGLKPKNKQ